MKRDERRLCFLTATMDDAPDIAALMRRVRDGLDVPSRFVIGNLEHVEWQLKENSWATLARDGEGRLVSFCIFMRPGHNLKENTGYLIGLADEELDHVLVVDSVAVAQGWRGLGLQRKLVSQGIREGRRHGFRHFMATVDPTNSYSLNNFLALGFEIVRKCKNLYGPDTDRLVLLLD